MEIIFHIGMGKTGTSSIQAALNANIDSLQAQGIDYLGMWFDLIDPEFHGIAGLPKFFSSSPEEMQGYADRFVLRLQEQQSTSGNNRFVLSNEDIYANYKNIAPFITALRAQSDVRLIAYARDPREWLPSAYNQWAIYHKVEPGPVKPYAEMARTHVKVYSGLSLWASLFGDIFTLRQFSKSIDVVTDFASVLGVEMEVPKARSLERVETSESLMRAIYNTRLPGQVLPDRFNHAFRQLDFAGAPSLAALTRDSFSYDQTDEIVAEHAALFAEIKDKLGLDLLSGPAPAQKMVDPEEMRQRALEHVLQIVMQQADRITHLEEIVGRLEAERKE